MKFYKPNRFCFLTDIPSLYQNPVETFSSEYSWNYLTQTVCQIPDFHANLPQQPCGIPTDGRSLHGVAWLYVEYHT